MVALPLSFKLRNFHRSSPMREGVLCWYPFEVGAKVLDYSGGVLTELLHHRGLVCIDGNTTADYIVVLDLAMHDTDTLKSLYGRLSSRGRMLIAYENPFALRFWAGANAPNTGLPYDSLFGRGDGSMPSKAELSERLIHTGFAGQKWYYLATDHWFTREVYSDGYLPSECMNHRVVPYISDDKFLQFDERPLYREVIRGGAFRFMCGAYFVEVCKHPDDSPCNVDYAAITAYREPAKRFATIVKNNGTVCKIPLHRDGIKTTQQIYKNHMDLSDLNLNIIETKLESNSLIMPRLDMPTLQDYWAVKLLKGKLDDGELFRHYDLIIESIYKSSVKGRCYWELVPANCFYDKTLDEIIFFDQEYSWNNTVPEAAIARALIPLECSPILKANPRSEGWLNTLKIRYGLTGKWDDLYKLARVKMHKEVFGNGESLLESATRHAKKRIRNRTKQRNDNILDG